LCGTNVETLEYQKLPQSNFENLYFVNFIVVSLRVFTFALPLMLNGYNSIVIVLALIVQEIDRLHFQETERVQGMNHLLLSFTVQYGLLVRASKSQNIDPTL